MPPDVALTITQNGEVYGDDVLLGRFFVAVPREIRDLMPDGDNLYKFPRIEDIEDNEVSAAFKQGIAQMSNVNPVTEMVNLIQTQRMVETYQKVMTTHMNDLNNEAISKLASVRA